MRGIKQWKHSAIHRGSSAATASLGTRETCNHCERSWTDGWEVCHRSTPPAHNTNDLGGFVIHRFLSIITQSLKNMMWKTQKHNVENKIVLQGHRNCSCIFWISRFKMYIMYRQEKIWCSNISYNRLHIFIFLTDSPTICRTVNAPKA